MSKMTEKEIIKIIREEYTRVRKSVREQELGSLSTIEIEELLYNFFARNGGYVPENIMKLSVLFPILQKAGLGNIVKSYNKTAKAFGKASAIHILQDVKDAIDKIINKDDTESVMKRKEESVYEMLSTISEGDRINIPFTSPNLVRDEFGKIDETGESFVWSVAGITNESDFMNSRVSLIHEKTGTKTEMTFGELVEYHGQKVSEMV